MRSFVATEAARGVCVHVYILSICIVLCFAYAIQRMIVFVLVCSSSSPTLGRCWWRCSCCGALTTNTSSATTLLLSRRNRFISWWNMVCWLGDLNCTNSRSLHELDDNDTYHKLNEASGKKNSKVYMHTNNYLQRFALLDGSHKIARTQEVM